MNSNDRTRRATDRHTKLSQVCPRDAAPTWRQRRMDDVRSWGWNSLCKFAPLSVTNKKSIPTVNIPSALLVRSSEHCSFHDSVCGRGENAARSCVMPWSHFICNCSCYRRAEVDGFPKLCNELLPSTSRTLSRLSQS